MYQERFHHLGELKRGRIPQNADARMRLHRNEKPESWPEAFRKRVFSTLPESVLERYPDPEPFYAKLAEFTGVAVENLLVASGIDEQIRTLIMLACGEGDGIAVPWPSYAMYRVYAEVFGGAFTPIPTAPDSPLTPTGVLEALHPTTRILFLPNPNQPVENCLDVNAVREIVAACRERKTIVAVDEAYHHFGAPTCAELTGEADNVIVMRTFSKAFGAAGVRLGYAIAGPKLIAPMNAVRLAHESNSLTLHAGCVLLDNFEAFVEPSVRDVREGRACVHARCRELGLKSWGEVSNNVLIELPSEEARTWILAGLEMDGIFVKGTLGPPMESHILVTCGSEALMIVFMDALATLVGR